MSLEEMTAKDEKGTLQECIDAIRFRITRGSHFEKATLPYSNYAMHAIDEDLPWLLRQLEGVLAKNKKVTDELAAMTADRDNLRQDIEVYRGELGYAVAVDAPVTLVNGETVNNPAKQYVADQFAAANARLALAEAVCKAMSFPIIFRGDAVKQWEEVIAALIAWREASTP